MPKNFNTALSVAVVFSFTMLASSCRIDDEFNKIVSGFSTYSNIVTTNTDFTLVSTEETDIDDEDISEEFIENTEGVEDYGTGDIKEKAPTFYADNKTFETFEEFAAIDDNTNAVKLTNGSEITFRNSVIAKEGKSLSELLTKEKGLNSAMLVKSNSEATMYDCEIRTSDIGAPALFVNGTGSKGRLNNLTVTTSGDSSAGIAVTENGFVEMLGNNITTGGELSPAVFIGKGGGTVSSTGGTITSNGANSPAIYCNGTFTGTGMEVTAAYSPAVEIDGRNTAVFTGSKLSSGREQAVRIYQRDTNSLKRAAKFMMTGGSLNVTDDTVFYVTNTGADIELRAVDFSGGGTFLRAEKNEEYGTNGADAKLTLNGQRAGGDITADEFSTIDFNIKNGSRFEGSVNYDNCAKSAKVYVDAISVWSLTGDCYVNDLICAHADFSNIIDNGFNIYYNSRTTKLGGKTIDLPGGGTICPYDISGEDDYYDDYEEE